MPTQTLIKLTICASYTIILFDAPNNFKSELLYLEACSFNSFLDGFVV